MADPAATPATNEEIVTALKKAGIPAAIKDGRVELPRFQKFWEDPTDPKGDFRDTRNKGKDVLDYVVKLDKNEPVRRMFAEQGFGTYQYGEELSLRFGITQQDLKDLSDPKYAPSLKTFKGALAIPDSKKLNAMPPAERIKEYDRLFYISRNHSYHSPVTTRTISDPLQAAPCRADTANGCLVFENTAILNKDQQKTMVDKLNEPFKGGQLPYAIADGKVTMTPPRDIDWALDYEKRDLLCENVKEIHYEVGKVSGRNAHKAYADTTEKLLKDAKIPYVRKDDELTIPMDKKKAEAFVDKANPTGRGLTHILFEASEKGLVVRSNEAASSYIENGLLQTVSSGKIHEKFADTIFKGSRTAITIDLLNNAVVDEKNHTVTFAYPPEHKDKVQGWAREENKRIGYDGFSVNKDNDIVFHIQPGDRLDDVHRFTDRLQNSLKSMHTFAVPPAVAHAASAAVTPPATPAAPAKPATGGLPSTAGPPPKKKDEMPWEMIAGGVMGLLGMLMAAAGGMEILGVLLIGLLMAVVGVAGGQLFKSHNAAASGGTSVVSAPGGHAPAQGQAQGQSQVQAQGNPADLKLTGLAPANHDRLVTQNIDAMPDQFRPASTGVASAANGPQRHT